MQLTYAMNSSRVKKYGIKATQWRLIHILPEIVEIASTLQVYLQRIILDKGIEIETNPSSNVVIGPIDGYGAHTIHQFIKNGIIASFNTDDKGIFSTSLYNKYSLYASSEMLMVSLMLTSSNA